MTTTKFDRTTQDVGNIIMLEHVNVTVPNQQQATTFYVTGLGLTRDPYIDFGAFNVWVNAGKQQFHLPTRDAQVLRGHTGLVVPDLDELEQRLERVSTLGNTAFDYERTASCIDVTCPWGNRIRCFKPPAFGDMALGIPYVELDVPVGTAAGIARFYTAIMDAPADIEGDTCIVRIGTGQTLRFRETEAELPPYDGHHIAIYIANFSGPWAALNERGLISEESDEHQYRFVHIVDPETGDKLFELEHEVRSLHHPMYGRPLVNRNAAQRFAGYVQGRDAFVP